MSKMVCIDIELDNDCTINLTMGKSYDVISIESGGGYRIKNDCGDVGVYLSYRFIPLSELRNDKLNLILNKNN